MEKEMFKRIMYFVCAFSFFFMVSTQNAVCKWDDKSDELPGMGGPSNGAVIGLAVGGAALIGVGVFILVKKSKKNKRTALNNNLEGNQYFINQKQTLLEKAKNFESKMPCNVYLAIGQPGYNYNKGTMNNKSFSLVLKFRF